MSDVHASDMQSEGGFLSRWSRRKRGLEVEEPAVQPAAPVAVATAAEPGVDDDPIDPRTGKRMSELTDEDMPDVETLTADSDVSMFMAKNISAALRMRALNKIFMSPKYNVYCLCAEYAEDYTNFTPLGDVVPHDLKSAIAREAGKLYERLTGQGVTVSQEELESRVAAQFRGEKTTDLEAEYLARAERDGALSESPTDDGSSVSQHPVADQRPATHTEPT
ncbi:MAG: DUF3306 domain-containing protein [Zoogloeaceae bacterium]|nr:DUF3306 domain-containing protein [Zoogloeaceae bacterium]